MEDLEKIRRSLDEASSLSGKDALKRLEIMRQQYNKKIEGGKVL